jgi:hypothetical protein
MEDHESGPEIHGLINNLCARTTTEIKYVGLAPAVPDMATP